MTAGSNLLDRFSPYLLLVLTTLFWGGNFNVARAVVEEVPPLGLSFWRWMIALLILIPFAIGPMRRDRAYFAEHWKLVCFLALLGVTLFNSLVYLGLQTTTAVNASLMQSINPVFIILLSMLLLGNRSGPRQWIGVLISMSGALVILIRGDIAVMKTLDFREGDLIVIIAVFAWGLYSVLLKRLPPAFKGLSLLGYMIVIGTLMILPFYLLETIGGRTVPLSPVSVASILYVAIFPSVLAYLFWNHAITRIGPERTGQFTHLIPVFGILIAILLLGETLRAFHIAGIVLVAAGLLLANARQEAA